MVNVLESTLEWTKGEVIVSSGIGPIHHAFLWIPPLGVTESMSRLQVERVGCDPQLVAAPVWQDWQKKLAKQVTNQSLLMAYRYFLGLQGF